MKYILIGLLLTLLIIGGGMVIYHGGFDSSVQTLYQCHKDETSGQIKRGDCKCAQTLYPDFATSYDWMDACLIEKTQLSMGK